MDLSQISLEQAANLLRQRSLSAVELTRFFLERIAIANPTLNAFITVDEEGALAAARRADERLARGEATPLTGIPLAVKDLFCTKGLRPPAPPECSRRFAPPTSPPSPAV